MADDIVTRLYCSYSDPPCESCTFCAARAEIERWRAEASIKGYRLDDALDEIERLRAHIEHLVSTHPLAAEYEAQTADPSAWMTDREARRG